MRTIRDKSEQRGGVGFQEILLDPKVKMIKGMGGGRC